jgi:hypothetical protein
VHRFDSVSFKTPDGLIGLSAVRHARRRPEEADILRLRGRSRSRAETRASPFFPPGKSDKLVIGKPVKLRGNSFE